MRTAAEELNECLGREPTPRVVCVTRKGWRLVEASPFRYVIEEMEMDSLGALSWRDATPLRSRSIEELFELFDFALELLEEYQHNEPTEDWERRVNVLLELASDDSAGSG